MATDTRIPRGMRGEAAAAAYLMQHGYRVLARNFRTRAGELDIVAADARCLVFCEVKTRVACGSAGPANPLEAIGPNKRRQVRQMAREWFARGVFEGERPAGTRFDAIGVVLDRSGRLLAL